MHFLHPRLGLVPSGFLTEILHTFRHLRVTCPVSSAFIRPPKQR
jgi:hypothetical protein